MASSSAITPTRPKSETRREVKRPRLWHVVMHDDDDHTYEYVIELLIDLFGFTVEGAYEVASRVDTAGRGVVVTVHKELAELKAEQIRHYGPDPRIASCTTSIYATIEPAEGEDDSDDSGDG
ncbi:MAG: ATP-dependent Clp protease adaptor ClpS [Planctomycetota bacterium]